MGTLYLVRHGQASFAQDNYDKLSELGHRQCVRLGEYFRARGIRFDEALVGTLVRQVESLEAISEGLQVRPPVRSWPGLNEYDSKAVVDAVHPAPLERPTTPELVRQHFRLLRNGLNAWMNGTLSPQGMPTYADWLANIVGALDHVRRNHDGHVLLVSSGGPIATAVGHVTGMPAASTIELNLRIRNSAVSEFAFTPKRHMLVTYNTLSHLDEPALTDWITYT